MMGDSRIKRMGGLAVAATLAIALAAAALPIPAGGARAASAPSGRVELSLADAIALAMRQNPDIVGANRALELERSKSRETSSSSLPKVVVQGSVTRAFILSGPDAGSSSTVSIPGVALSQVLPGVLPHPFTAGLSSTELAAMSVEGAELDLAAVRQRVTFDVISSYLGVLRAEQMTALAGSALERAEGFLDEVETKLALGVATELDLVRARNQLDQAKFNQVKAADDLAGAMRVLATLLGLPRDTQFELVSAFEPQEETRSLDDLIALALASRPEVRQAELAVERSRAALESAKRSRWPSVSLSATYSATEHDVSVNAQASLGLTSGDAGWKIELQGGDDRGLGASSGIGGGLEGIDASSVGLDVSWTLWDGGSTAEQVKQAEIGLETQQAALERQRQAIVEEVHSALVALRQSLVQLELAGKAEDEAEQTLRVTEARFAAGAGVVSEVIDAAQALASAKADAVGALFDCYAARARLDKALGTLGAQAPGVRSQEGR